MANKFISGTLILTLSGFVVKAIGSINWIILSRILGGEGIGIYQMAFPIYLLALDISSAGLPIAISIITAEKVAKQDYFGAQRIFHVSLSMLCTTALFLSILMFFGSSFLIDEHIIRESRAYYSLIALAPAIFFTTIIAGYRGYLQGWQQMTPTAISQIVEQLVASWSCSDLPHCCFLTGLIMPLAVPVSVPVPAGLRPGWSWSITTIN
jgi:stage V sporulation protein B